MLLVCIRRLPSCLGDGRPRLGCYLLENGQGVAKSRLLPATRKNDLFNLLPFAVSCSRSRRLALPCRWRDRSGRCS